jgi:hypothetical protein
VTLGYLLSTALPPDIARGIFSTCLRAIGLLFRCRAFRIVAWFDSLNPYNFPGSILKIEEVNYNLQNSKVRAPLFVWAVSAKRYALFNIENGQPVIRKASAHGLGHLQAPSMGKNLPKGFPHQRPLCLTLSSSTGIMIYGGLLLKALSMATRITSV